MLAVLHGLNVFKQFLSLSSEIHLFTDHISTAFYNNIKQNSCNGRISRWAMILSQYSITVHFTEGKKHFLPDLLSRREYPTGIASEIDESGLDEYVLALSNDCNFGANNEFETSPDNSQLVASAAERHLQLESESAAQTNIRPDTNYKQRPHASGDPDSERHLSNKSETNDLHFISPSEIQYLTSAISRFDENSDRPLSGIINQSVNMHAIADNGDYYQSVNTHLFSRDDFDTATSNLLTLKLSDVRTAEDNSIYSISLMPLQETVDAGKTPSTDQASDEHLPFGRFDSSQMALNQRSDPELKLLIEYLESGTLPPDLTKGRRIVAESNNYFLDNNILFHVKQSRCRKPRNGENLVKQLAIPKKQNRRNFARSP